VARRFRAVASIFVFASLLTGALLPSAANAQTADSNAHWYIATYTNDVLVWDEATEEVVDRIELQNRIPIGLELSKNQERLYALDPFFEKIEVVELGTRETIDEIELSRGRTTVRINSFSIDPDEEWAILFVKKYTKESDRWIVEGPFMLKYDLSAKAVTDTIPYPGPEMPNRAGFRLSPNGDALYVFDDALIALDTDTFEEIDRWDISEPLEPGLGPMALPFSRSPYQEDNGIYTGLFRVTDPAQNRRMMGIATVDLNNKQVDFSTFGPAEGVSFVLAADGKTAYGLQSDIGHYEFWKFDVAANRVAARVPFEGRPRMGLMPSADGTRLFVFVAGNTIDVYDSQTFELLRTVELDEDMTDVLVIPDRETAGGR
jgi:DNA-binding beta-propeller fold protein YncE